MIVSLHVEKPSARDSETPMMLSPPARTQGIVFAQSRMAIAKRI
jgi:hypothetical protein